MGEVVYAIRIYTFTVSTEANPNILSNRAIPPLAYRYPTSIRLLNSPEHSSDPTQRASFQDRTAFSEISLSQFVNSIWHIPLLTPLGTGFA
jgi:hypothetical protein